jgi:hypothetical protein
MSEEEDLKKKGKTEEEGYKNKGKVDQSKMANKRKQKEANKKKKMNKAMGIMEKPQEGKKEQGAKSNKKRGK